MTLTVVMTAPAGQVRAQTTNPRLFPDRALLPAMFAGPRDPVAKAELVLVADNPNAFGPGAEMEVAIGTTFPVVRLGDLEGSDTVVLGIEGAAFARFGLQVLQRELIGSDWIFALPFVWHRGGHWFRFGYYHTSSHLGDEYANRFEAKGVNFARDALDGLARLRLSPTLAAHGGVRWSYNVHPEESGRWTVRSGVHVGPTAGPRPLLPYGTADVELESDTDWRPRVHLQAGVWLPEMGGRRAMRLGIGFLTGPPTLGQFRAGRTTQFTLGVSGNP